MDVTIFACDVEVQHKTAKLGGDKWEFTCDCGEVFPINQVMHQTIDDCLKELRQRIVQLEEKGKL